MMLDGKVALITGSAKGLGRRTALELARLGCNVVVNYSKSGKEALELVDELESIGVRSIAVQADIARREDVFKLYHEAEDRFGGIDILVNNAGPFIRERRTFAEYPLEQIDYILNGNLTAAVTLDYLVLPHMRTSGWGRIVHFGFSKSAEARGWPHRGVYAAAKVALVSLTKTLAVEEAPHGITVNMICPGDIRGEYKEQSIAEVEDIADEETPRGRPGAGEDISRVISFLCEPRSDFFTGNIMDVSGGLDPIRSLPLMSKRTY